MKPIIELIYDEPKFKIDAENMIYEAVQNVGVNFDKDRLVKALIDSRSFYEEGYAEAKKKYDKKWIPCSEKLPNDDTEVLACNVHGDIYMLRFKGDMEYCEDYWIDEKEEIKEDIIAWQQLPPKFEG